MVMRWAVQYFAYCLLWCHAIIHSRAECGSVSGYGRHHSSLIARRQMGKLTNRQTRCRPVVSFSLSIYWDRSSLSPV